MKLPVSILQNLEKGKRFDEKVKELKKMGVVFHSWLQWVQSRHAGM